MNKSISLTIILLLIVSVNLKGQNAKLRFQEYSEFHRQVKERVELLKDDPTAMVKGLTIPGDANSSEKIASSWVYRLDSIIGQQYDDYYGLWSNNWKSDFHFDTLVQQYYQSQLGQTDYLWNPATSGWDNDYKEDYTFSVVFQFYNVQIESITSSNWDTLNSVWKYAYKDEYQYDSTNLKILLRLFSDWGDVTNQFEPYYRMEYTYDSSGMPEQVLAYFWDTFTLQWVNSTRTDYIYSSNPSLVDEIVEYYWMSYLSQYVPYSKTEFTYFPNDSLHYTVYYNYNQITQQFEPNEKVEYTYNSAGTFVVRKTIYNYNKLLSQFEEFFKEEHTILPLGAVTQTLWSEYDSSTNQWKNLYRDNYTSDLAVNREGLLLPFSYRNEDIDHLFRYKLTKIEGEYFDDTTSSWVAHSTSDLYYSFHVWSVEEHQKGGVKVFPNPATTHINFELSGIQHGAVTVELYDMQGRRVLASSITDGSSVDVGTIGKGVYIYRIISERSIIHHGKVVIQ